jgi:hypothetical protein
METGSDLGYRNSDRSFTYARLNPKIRDTIFVHANSSGWKGDLQPFLCLGAGAAGALCLATTVSIASQAFWGVLAAAPPPTPSSWRQRRRESRLVIMTFLA